MSENPMSSTRMRTTLGRDSGEAVISVAVVSRRLPLGLRTPRTPRARRPAYEGPGRESGRPRSLTRAESRHMRVADLTVGLLAYYVGTDYVYALLVDQQGDVRRFRLLSCRQASPLIDDLRDVMEQPLAFPPSEVAAVFHDFCHDWGRRLLPPPEALEPFDVLVVVPHHFLHGLP